MRGPVFAFALASALAVGVEVQGAPPACPAAGATLTVHADNLSDEAAVQLSVSGALLEAGATCAGDGATAYATTLTCAGSGLVSCGEIPDLQPGAWVHRVEVTVPDSAPQMQARRAVTIAGGANPLVWTVYPRTFVVTQVDEVDLRAQLTAASDYTAATGRRALVTFSAATFPGAASPQTIDLTRGPCTPDPTRRVALCHTGSQVVVDVLDALGARGGVVLSVGSRDLSLLRVYGVDNVFRGLAFSGSRIAAHPSQLDTVAFADPGTLRNRLEQCLVDGPTFGDGVSAENGAGAGGNDAEANVVDDCEVRGAEDKGIKITTQALALVRGSCVHDNRNGGVQVTFGGRGLVRENVVQHNVPGPAGNGVSATGNEPTAPSRLVTDGNVVRFAGARGVSIVDHAIASLANDYVADNQFIGLKVETTDGGPTGLAPWTRARGVALVCNRNAGVSGACGGPAGTVPCVTATDCCGIPQTCCVSIPGCSAPILCDLVGPVLGFGASLSAATGTPLPSVDLGDSVLPGRNALAHNRNEPLGANLHLNLPDTALPARDDQWEHCGDGPLCDTDAVVSVDLRLAPGATLDMGTSPGPRAGMPVARAVSPPRPRRGDLVRVYGDNFDAVNGTDCAGTQAPADACAADNPAVRLRNALHDANRIRLRGPDGQVLSVGPGDSAAIFPDAVTPTMLAFRMPVDCFAPMLVEISKPGTAGGARLTTAILLCDVAGCAGQPAGLACDDGNACTLDDRCTGGDDGTCRGTTRVCTGGCLSGACDPASGCVPKPSSAACDDGDRCTIGDHCAGLGDVCMPGLPRVCDGGCETGACDPTLGCVAAPAATECRPAAGPCDERETCDGAAGTCPPDAAAPATRSCDDGNACTVGDHCSGAADRCLPGVDQCCARVCLTGVWAAEAGCVPSPAGTPCPDDGDPCTQALCDGAGGCVEEPLVGPEADLCRIRLCQKPRLRARLDRLAVDIRDTIAAGKTPRARKLSRVGRLLRRCRVGGAGS